MSRRLVSGHGVIAVVAGRHLTGVPEPVPRPCPPTVEPLSDPRPGAVKPGFHGVRTRWIRGFMAFRLAQRTRTVRLTVPMGPESGFRERGELSDRLGLRGAVGSCHDHGRDHAERSVEGARHGQVGSLADPARFMPRRRAFQIPVPSYGPILVVITAVIAGDRLYRRSAY